ncbi:bifunctional hydroxymethylpyrimidine kinase/phosphomethylpyrimidine kinase [Nocardioides jishulii]|uniref:Bifunctional hydroxymethylpyrimidine kinase/phosphomethylpyrimidine kinase n=1 Tax=Nocardioides jishulii TaxID=2575440 RepID=A0A4U2YH17_9ACTN|nr:bifunctional hydroxymethylpyrimidine kinase/phosphomethylpyrimidine kinase [Nocardioides jishulii]QCX26704.1 bifunctional hydroxymethylpyrimidine kinase/phosphomethylpyrimidine kinase [Nocardioides jishulii]TKI60326.1 bifunctional hydroxymethylpyrimidine kinase/phosphomethylpyrimidine kinase [Nocardioides jishulii]
MTTPPVVLTIAGTDSGGAAGIAADVATIGHLGAHAACVVTAVTAQDTLGVRVVHPVPVEVVAAQLDAVLEDLPVAAVKTGMLGSPEVVELVARRVRAAGVPVVVDPVLVATSGAVLGDEAVVRAYLAHLLPLATVCTPNLDEARVLCGRRSGTARDLASQLTAYGPAALVTGGDDGRDWLAVPGHRPVEVAHPSVATTNDHGTGCTHSSALATHLAHGLALGEAAGLAAAYVVDQLVAGSGWHLGRGRGPVAHTVAPGIVPVPRAGGLGQSCPGARYGP